MMEVMFCEKYHAKIPVTTCIARQKRAAGGRLNGIDPGCVNCTQGIEVMRRHQDPDPEKDLKKQESIVKPEKTKVCRVCGEEKPINDFYKHSECKDGHEGQCKACKNQKKKSPVTTTKSTNKKSNCEMRITIDFEEHRDLFSELVSIAESDFRPIEYQILYFVKKGAVDARRSQADRNG